MCCTFSFVSTAVVLQRGDQRLEQLDWRTTFSPKDIVPHSPVTEHHTGPQGMNITELGDAAMTESDNAEANLLSFGGAPALTEFFQSVGDSVSPLTVSKDC
jgi:beta-lactamase class A